MAVLQLVSDTIEYKTLLKWYLWLRFINVKQRLRAENEFLKMQHNPIVIQLNTAMAQLHKKCDFANFTLIFSFKLSSDDKTNKFLFYVFTKGCLSECALLKYAFHEEQWK